ncbi:unnamed protein product [Closterium sp. NIES-53]
MLHYVVLRSSARISPPATTASSALSAAAAGARVASSATAASAASFRLSLRDGAATSTLCSACASASLTSSTLSASSTRLLHRGEFFTGRRLAMASAAVVPTGGAHEEAGLGKGEETTHAVPVQATAIHDTHKIHVASPDDAAHRPAVPVRSHDMLAPFTAAHQFTDAHPLVIVKSEGVYIWDSDGRRYLDGLAGLWSTALGGNEQRLIDAADAQMKKLPFYHSFWNRATEPAMELAKELTGMFTAERMGQVFFTNSGSDANDTQVKLVWYYNNALGRPNKKKFIARDKAYHGSTLVSASLTGLSPLHKSFDLPVDFVLHTDCPHYWRYGRPGESEQEYSTRLADSLEALIEREGADTIAAFIAEPVMGAGGVILPPAGYFEKVQAILRKHDILFIVDEVVCGFGRLGTMFGSDLYDLQPDLVTLAKALSSAYMPIGAVMISHRIAHEVAAHSNKMGSFAHGFTYSGHPVACAVALEAVRMYQEMDVAAVVQAAEPLFQGGIRHICRNSPIVGEVRGQGLILAIELADPTTKEPFPSAWAVGPFFGQCAAAHGLIVRTIGDAIAMSPALTISPGEIQELLSVIRLALKETEAYVQSKIDMD